MRRAVLLIVPLLVAGTLAVVDSPAAHAAVIASNWKKLAPKTSPFSEEGGSLAYDAATNEAVLLGGIGKNDLAARYTWTYDGSTWTAHPAQTNVVGAMVYDPALGELVVSGYNGTWVGDGVTWTLANAQDERGRLLYDAELGEVVAVSNDYNYLVTITAFDGSAWSPVPTVGRVPIGVNPPASFDEASGDIVLVTASGVQPDIDNETWTFDGSAWTEQSAPTTGILCESLTYDPALRTSVCLTLEGTPGSYTFGTWTYDSSGWTQQAEGTSVPGRSNYGVTYDGGTGSLLLFGGQEINARVVLGDSWALKGTKPVVTGVTPTAGPIAGGTTVTITGSGLVAATGVTFGGVPATNVQLISDGELTAVTPAEGSGTHNVAVTNALGTSPRATAAQFTFERAPSVSSLSPARGTTLGGTTITITGTNFTADSTVLFGSVPSPEVHVVSATELTAVSPAEAVSSHRVVVTTPGGLSAASGHDNYAFVAPPDVYGLSPFYGPTAGGTVVTIIGSGFTSATSVMFGAYPASSFTVVSPTYISAISPAERSGGHNVVVTTPIGSNAPVTSDRFTFINQVGS